MLRLKEQEHDGAGIHGNKDLIEHTRPNFVLITVTHEMYATCQSQKCNETECQRPVWVKIRIVEQRCKYEQLRKMIPKIVKVYLINNNNFLINLI